MDTNYDVQLKTQPENCDSLHAPWNTLLDEPLHRQAQKAAFLVAGYLRDPEYVQGIIRLTRKQCSSSTSWDLTTPSSIAELALFYCYVARCFPNQDWQTIAQRYLNLIAMHSQQYDIISPSLFSGISGIAFVIQQFSQAGQRYQQTLAHLHQSIAKQVHKHSAWQKVPETGVAEHDFDVIVGASGIIGYLASIPSPDPIVHEIVHTLLSYLLVLTQPGQILGQERWFSPPSLLLTERDRQKYPYGRFNCGLAHGIAGPLAALSLATMAGYHSPGLQESITFVSEWLIEHQIHDEWGATWPAAIPYELASSPRQWQTLSSSRTAWCYGTPGIARSLWLAGRALNKGHLMKVALDAFKSALHRPPLARGIDGPTLCHGHAGLLLLCLRFAHESQDPLLLEQIPQLVEYLLTHFDPQNPLGFRDIESRGIQLDKPDFLTGASGTALVLLAATSKVAPSWDRLLLIS